MYSITGLRNIVENIKDKHMETLKLLIGIDEQEVFERAAKDMKAAEATISFEDTGDGINTYVFISAPLMAQIARVIFWAGYLKANEMHKTLNK